MAYNQNIFDVLNMSQNGKVGGNGLDPDKRHYQCIDNEGLITCVRTIEMSAKGKHLTISKGCPEIFDRFTLSYKIGTPVSAVRYGTPHKNLNAK
jgi:hypothetical protein